MRTAFFSLLLANLAFYAWANWLSPNVANAAPTAADPVPQLVLAAEAKAETPGKEATPATDTSGSSPLPAQPDAPQVAAATPANAARCVSLGPFQQLAELAHVSAAMREAGYEPRERVEQGDQVKGYWVYLDEFRNRKEALEAKRELVARGLPEAMIMPGENVVLSVGLFSDEARANRVAGQVRELGMKPVVSDRTQRGTLYWMDITLKATDGFIDPASLQSESGRIIRVTACPTADAADPNAQRG
ncbi:MAG TPA: hypothetical protein VE046_02675 [Steroidobacteraceae bacterium]|nr:hypothetical protein [Steroidobacteraceae bacterium]